MSSGTPIQIFKNGNNTKVPAIRLPSGLSTQELTHPFLVKSAKELFEANGVLSVHNLFPQALITQLARAFAQDYNHYFEDRDYEDALEVGNRRHMVTLGFKEPFNTPALYGNVFLMYLMRELLGDDFVLGSFGVVLALPGAQHQHIHRDHPPLFENESLDLKVPSFAITAVVPLVDLTPETGSTRVWKGSHRICREIKPDSAQSDIPYLPIGSCYLMDYQLLHGGTPNRSASIRPILYLIYYRSWFQEAVNYDKQARIAMSQKEYTLLPEKYKFLFERNREALGIQNVVKVNPLTCVKQDDFTQLTSMEQAQRLTEVAKAALVNYGFQEVRLKLLSHGDNTVFSVTLPNVVKDEENTLYSTTHYILRIHRASYLSSDAIASEMQWLQYLSQEAKLPVPVPMPTQMGKLCTTVNMPTLPEARVCSLTRWINGTPVLSGADFSRITLIDIERIGRLMATMHNCASHWGMPLGFHRPRWTWDGLFGQGAGYSQNGQIIWDQVPSVYKPLFEVISDRMQIAMNELGRDPEQFGLIHADLCPGNLLKFGNEICVIDFADCGFGYWGYELAMFLSYFTRKQAFSLCLEKLLYGYNQVRPFPVQQIPYLRLFVAAQYVTLSLWRINRSNDHPGFRANLETDLQTVVEQIKAILKD